ncbi:MAG: hypothetical protein M3Y80_03800, partial [Verrucomicrobiota bacterium]|nr:hypothetical protein [Verrucomicrobiota bacterium]
MKTPLCFVAAVLVSLNAVLQAAPVSLQLDENFRAPLFTRPVPAARTLLLPDGKYLLFWSTNTLTDQRTGALTRYFPDGTLDPSFSFSHDYSEVSAVALTSTGQFIVAATQLIYGAPQTKILRLYPNGAIDPVFDPVFVANDTATYNVRAITIQPDGKILAAGLFSSFSGFNRQKIVRLLANGAIDPTFASPQLDVDRGIYTRPVVLINGKILIAGDFTQVNGSSSSSIARLNADGSRDSTFQPSGFVRVNGYSVRGLVVQPDGKIVMAARFTIGGSTLTRAPLFRLNPDGSADSFFTSVTTVPSAPSSRDLAAQADGKLVLATGHSFYRFQADGTLDNSFTPPGLIDSTNEHYVLSGQGLTVNVQPNGQILLGGAFSDVNASGGGADAHFGVARVNVDGSLDPSLITTHKTGVEVPPRSFTRLTDGSTLVSVTYFEARIEPSVPFHFARLLSDGARDASFALSSSDPASILTHGFLAGTFDRLADGKLLTGGTLYSDGSDNVGKFQVSGVEDPTFRITGAIHGLGRAIAIADGRSWLVGGDDAQATADGVLNRLTIDGRIDVSFHLADEIKAAQISRYSDGGLRQMAIGSSVLAVQPDGKVIFLYLALDDQLFHLVRLNTDGSIDSSFTSATLPAYDLVLDYPVVFDPNTGSALQPPEGVWRADATVRSGSMQPDGKIVLAGRFTSYNGTVARGIVRLLPDGSVDSSFAAGSGAQWTQTAATSTFFPFIENMAVQPDGKLLVVGTFEAFNGVTRAGIASLNADGSVDTSFTPGAKRNKYSPNTTRLAAQPDGSFLLSGPYS